ncbi:terminase gpA endonuclease subunit [Thalassoglobus polymorphus]|uniref:Phage terminase large subunit (GpA) n=1 Tax=Thalassoglobus polymorphus TaxID=2527994 RepID=A0A517QH59_9PLAN|nr:terminase gpA endonuclease subunit [Thalassoglobus polymorphus]QDT30927.1 Phage terminase large subunit (GpA) [Thalassoglobus polymorphus]QDT30972.1 Phage terminase large subunit (GpA) [Thalassoglobus polymorphus]
MSSCSKDEASNNWHAENRAASQDVFLNFKAALTRGPVEPQRRADCKFDFLSFCDHYGGEAFSLPWSNAHRRAAELIQSAAINGDQFAFAMPRGSGKTTVSRWAVVWSVLYGHSPYSVLIGKTQNSAQKLLKSLKSSFRFSEPLFADFPEIIAPLRHLKGETRKAQGQKFQGEPTMIEWAQNQVVFAYLPESYIKEARLKFGDDYGAGCGSIIDVCGIEGEIRGRQYERPSGAIVRPTLAVVDDPQDRESAKSTGQCDEREQVIKADVRYLAGPDRATGIVIPCTVIYENDVADRLLNRKENPEFQGEKSQLVEAFPGTGLSEPEQRATDALWQEYRRIRNESFENGNKGVESSEFYLENRPAMDAGSKMSWPERYFAAKGEISAVQHAMNLFFSDEMAFMAEYQNKPLRTTEDETAALIPQEVARRLSGVSRNRIPDSLNRLTAFIDVSKDVLWYTVTAWGPGFTGSIVSYGAFPDQPANHFTLSTIKNTLAEGSAAAGEGAGLESSIAWGLRELTSDILGREYLTESGDPLQVELCLIDTNWNQSTEVVNAFCRRSRFKGILYPSRGRGVTSPDDALVSPKTKPKPGERRGQWWKLLPSRNNGGRYVLFSSNHWKTFIYNRLSVPVGEPGALSLYQANASAHKMLAEQLTAERCTRVTIKGETLDKWNEIPGRDNHLWDCVAGCAVGASMLGEKLTATAPPKKAVKRRKRRRVSNLLS